MRRLYVSLQEADLEKLKALARQDRRHPSDQAAILLESALRQDQCPYEAGEEGSGGHTQEVVTNVAA